MSVANSYAKALYEAAREDATPHAGLEQIKKHLSVILTTIQSSREAQIALLGLITTVREKEKIITELCKRLDFSALMVRFLTLLAKKNRLNLLAEIIESFETIQLKSEGGVLGKLISTDPIAQSDLEILVKAFSNRLGKQVAFRVSTDPSLLAGIKVIVNGVTYDGTLRSQLQKLRDRFAAEVPAS